MQAYSFWVLIRFHFFFFSFLNVISGHPGLEPGLDVPCGPQLVHLRQISKEPLAAELLAAHEAGGVAAVLAALGEMPCTLASEGPILSGLYKSQSLFLLTDGSGVPCSRCPLRIAD